MKIAVVADLHIHERREFSTPTTWRGIAMGSRLARQLEDLIGIFKMAAARGADRVVVLGDVFDTAYRGAVPTSVVAGLREAFYDCVVPLVVVRGNHDGHSPADPDVLSAVVPGLEAAVAVCNHVVWAESIAIDGLVFIPYGLEVGRALDAWAWEGGDGIAFVHADVEGAVVAGDEIVAAGGIPQSSTSGYRLVVGGHIHRRQRLGNIQIIGPPWQNGFGEGDFEVGTAILDTESLEVEFVPSTSPKFVTIEVKTVADVEAASAAVAAGHFVRARVPHDFLVPADTPGLDSIRVERLPAPTTEGVARVDDGEALDDVLRRYVEETVEDLDSAAVIAEALTAFDSARAAAPVVAFPKRSRS